MTSIPKQRRSAAPNSPRIHSLRERKARASSKAPQLPNQQKDEALTEEVLCSRCAAIDLDSIFSQRPVPEAWPGKVIMRFGSRDAESTRSACQFCKALFAMAPKPRGDMAEDLYLYALTPTDHLSHCAANVVVLEVVHRYDRGFSADAQYLCQVDGFIGVTNTGGTESGNSNSSKAQSRASMTGRLIKPKKIDFDLIRGWISDCRARHHSVCSSKHQSAVSSLRLINCRTRQIEMANADSRYAALSYVWGATHSSSNVHNANESLAGSLPRTIEDAVKVVKKLKMKYLWIDRYCIIKDGEHKSDQINQMDKIYQNAKITIVAAAGSDPTFGLPGISTRRVLQQVVSLPKYTLASTMRNPGHLVGESRWSKRAWTYQEMICSKRLLIFTEEQVYFHCQSGEIYEAVHRDEGFKSASAYSSMVPVNDSVNVMEHIAEYSKRELTYDSDALNGMLGIFRILQTAKYPVYHYWGVPMLPLDEFDSIRRPRMIHRSATDIFIAGLCWKSVKSGRRRTSFPSWSWTGYTCHVDPNSRAYGRYSGNDVSDLGINIWVYLDNNHQLSFQEYFESYIQKGMAQQLSKSLRIEAWTIQLRMSCKPYYLGLEPQCSMGICPAAAIAGSLLVQGYLDLDSDKVQSAMKMNSESEEIVGILLAKPDDTRSVSGSSFLLVVQKKGDHYERIGSALLYDSEVRFTEEKETWGSHKIFRSLTLR